MIPRLILALRLLMFKVYGNFGTSEIEFFSFSETERVKQNQIKIKTTQNFVT